MAPAGGEGGERGGGRGAGGEEPVQLDHPGPGGGRVRQGHSEATSEVVPMPRIAAAMPTRLSPARPTVRPESQAARTTVAGIVGTDSSS